MRFNRAAGLLLVMAVLGLPNGTGRAAGPGAGQEPGSASTVTGRVVRADTGAPVPGAIVRGLWGEGVVSFFTDRDGRFALSDAPSGVVAIEATKFGYLPDDPGARALAGSESLPVSNIAATRHVVLRMRPSPTNVGIVTDPTGLPVAVPDTDRHCSIAGRALDEFGEPLAAAIRAVDVTGPREPGFAHTTKTDSRGGYCLASLGPSEYVLSATPEVPSGTLESYDASGQIRPVTLPTVYYPGVTTSTEASRIVLAGASPATFADLIIRATPASTVTVKVRSDVGPVLVPRLSIAPSGDREGVERSLHAVAGGFRVSNLIAGHYRILASTTNVLGTRFVASIEIETDGTTPGEFDMAFEPAARLVGRLVFDGASAPPKTPQLWLDLIDPVHASTFLWPGAVNIDETGAFVINGAMPGEYVIQAADDKGRQPQRWSLVAATMDGRDVLDLPVEVPAGGELTGLVLTLTDKITELSGTVLDPANQPVARGIVTVFSADRRYWRAGSRRVRMTELDRTGHYAIRDIPPGDYHVALMRDPDQAHLQTMLEQLQPSAVQVELSAGDRRRLDLRETTPSSSTQ